MINKTALAPDEIHQIAFEEGQPADNGDGYLFTAEEFDLFVQRLLDSVAIAEPVPPAGGEPEVYRKPADYWEGYTAHVCYKDINDLKEMVHHLEGVLDDVPEGELVDRAHVTRLQAEVERLRNALEGEVIARTMDSNADGACILDLQAELTKARELLTFVVNSGGFSYKTVAKEIRAFLSNQSAPADDSYPPCDYCGTVPDYHP